MKIYKNPDGSNLDLLYPTMFFGSLGAIFFFILKTCISMDQFWGIALGALIGSYLIYYFIIRKRSGVHHPYANLFLASTMTPFLVALSLATNYFVSTELFRAKIEIDGHIKVLNNTYYVRHDNAPQVCSKLYRISNPKGIYDYNFIETRIDLGILGFPVLKYHHLTMD